MVEYGRPAAQPPEDGDLDAAGVRFPEIQEIGVWFARVQIPGIYRTVADSELLICDHAVATGANMNHHRGPQYKPLSQKR